MQIFDIVIGGIFLYGFYKGIRNGLFIELASLISLVAGIYICLKFASGVKDILAQTLHWNGTSIMVLAFVITFLGVVIGIHFLGKILTKLASFAFLGWANSLGGAFLHTLKIVLILGICFSVFDKINYNHFIVKQETLNNSLFYNSIEKVAKFMFPMLQEWYEAVKK